MFATWIIRLCVNRKGWRKLNKRNYTTMKRYFRSNKVHAGNMTYGGLHVLDYGPAESSAELFIGSFCSIADDVIFILSGEHNIESISTYPFKVMALQSVPNEAGDKGDIVVGDDVWIGERATVCSGVRIGQGAVIAAGAVVTKDVPPYAVAGGVPAKVIKYRFSDGLIKELLKVDYSRLTPDMIREHIDDLYRPLTSAGQLDWMPKKS